MNRVSAAVVPRSWTYRLQIDRLLVLLQSRLIMASKCISKLTRSRPLSAIPHSLDHGLQVHLQTLSIAASKCISKLTQSQPPSASPKSLDHGFQLHLQTRSIAASKCISKLAQSQPPSASSNSLNPGLRVYLWVHSIVIFRRTSNLGKIECVFRIMRCLFTPGSPKYILPVAESISVIHVSPNVYI